jgi:hypothetical protein
MLSATLMNQDMAGYEMTLEMTHRSLYAPAETVRLSQLDGDVTTGNLKEWSEKKSVRESIRSEMKKERIAA